MNGLGTIGSGLPDGKLSSSDSITLYNGLGSSEAIAEALYDMWKKREFIDLNLRVGGESDFGRETQCIGMHRIVAALISDKFKAMVDHEMTIRSASEGSMQNGAGGLVGKRRVQVHPGQVSPNKKSCSSPFHRNQENLRAREEGNAGASAACNNGDGGTGDHTGFFGGQDMDMHSIFLDGQVEAACSRADGSGSVDVLPGSLVPGFFQTREGTKMLRMMGLDDSGMDEGGTPQYQVIELATKMSCSGAVEYYEWVPADRLSSFLSEALQEEVLAWDLQHSSQTGLDRASERPKRYFRDPIKKCVTGCRKVKAASNAPKQVDGESSSQYWSVDDMLYEIDSLVEEQFTLSNGDQVSYLEIQEEVKLVEAATRAQNDCAKGSFVTLNEDYVVCRKNGQNCVVRVTSILAPCGSYGLRPIATIQSNGDYVGMCRPYCLQPIPGSDTGTANASDCAIRGREFGRLDKNLSNVPGDVTYWFDAEGPIKSFSLSEVAGVARLRKLSKKLLEAASASKLVRSSKDDVVSYWSVHLNALESILSEKSVVDGTLQKTERTDGSGTKTPDTTMQQPSISDLDCPGCGKEFSQKSGGRMYHIKRCLKRLGRVPCGPGQETPGNRQVGLPECVNDQAGVPRLYEAQFGSGEGLVSNQCGTPHCSPRLSHFPHTGTEGVDEIGLNFSPMQPAGRLVNRLASSTPLVSGSNSMKGAANSHIPHYHASLPETGMQGFDEALVGPNAAHAVGENPLDRSSERLSAGAGEHQSYLDLADAGRGPVQIYLPKLHPDAVLGILEFHYGGQVMIEGLNSLLALAAAVDEFQVESMIELVRTKIVECVNAETCVPIMQQSPPSWREPFHVAWRFALSQFDKVACSRSFLKLDPNRLEELLKNDRLCVSSEYDLYEHVLRWMCSDDPEVDFEVDGFFVQQGADSGADGRRHDCRACRGKTLLQYIRYPLIDAKTLALNIFRDKRLMAGSAEFWKEVQPLVEETMAWHLSESKDTLLRNLEVGGSRWMSDLHFQSRAPVSMDQGGARR